MTREIVIGILKSHLEHDTLDAATYHALGCAITELEHPCKPENSPVDERKADEGIIGRIEELERQIKYFKGWVGDLQELCIDLKERMDNNAEWHKDVDVAQEDLEKRIDGVQEELGERIDDLNNTIERYDIRLSRLVDRIEALEK